MPEPKTQIEKPGSRVRVAIGAGDPFPVVLIEAHSALGVLVAKRCCPGEILEGVLYFRSLMGEPYARFFKTVELLTLDGFSVARVPGDEALFLEPSSRAYAVKNISEDEYEQFVDDVCAYRRERAEQFIAMLFANAEGFFI